MFPQLGNPGMQFSSGAFAAFGSSSTFTPANAAPTTAAPMGPASGNGASGAYSPSYELMQEPPFGGAMGGFGGMGGAMGGFGGMGGSGADPMSSLMGMMGMMGTMMQAFNLLRGMLPGMGGPMAQVPMMPGFGKRAPKTGGGGRAAGADKPKGSKKSEDSKGGGKAATSSKKIGGDGSKKYDSIILEAAKKYDVDPNLIKSVIKQESNFNPTAGSGAGASGLMQLMPATAASLGCKNVKDPRQNIFAGTKYLAQQLKAHKGNVKLALASYNAGPGAVAKYNGVPPFAETQNYVKKITADLANRKKSA